MERMRRRTVLVGVAVVAGVALLVVAVIGSWGQDTSEPAAEREAFCVGVGLQIDDVVAAFERSTDDADRELLRDTAGLIFSADFVAGAPAEVEDEAAGLRDAVLELGDGAADAAAVADVRARFERLRTSSQDTCARRSA